MSRTGKIRVFFGDAEHDFCLRIGELIELEEKTGDGVFASGTSSEAMPRKSELEKTSTDLVWSSSARSL